MKWITSIFTRAQVAVMENSFDPIAHRAHFCPVQPIGTQFSCTVDGEKFTTLLREAYNIHEDNCSGFVREVARRLDIALQGAQADNQIDYMKTNWITVSDANAAVRKVEEGWLVVAGLKAKEISSDEKHGHVAIVVAGPIAHGGKYPTVWSASIGQAKSAGEKTLNYIFPSQVRDSVHFYGAPSKTCLS